MQVYNTMTRKKEPIPDARPISIYACGPTVYLSPHIGNWRKFVFDDTLRRVLDFNFVDVVQTMNLTDVGHLVGDGDEGEDKLQKTATAQRKTAWDVADHYIEEFKDGAHDLNIIAPEHLARATEYIQQQIGLVQNLEDKGYTYVIDDGVYFDTSKLTDYGKLARLDIKNLKEGARVQKNDQKRQPTDFALWKFSPKNHQRDMEWESPWGVGFPGWHVECSAIAAATLGESITIHTGGIDHIPVHHTNEIAQSESAFGVEFAKIWMHNEFITVDGEKMAKSKGNVYTLTDIIEKGYDPLDLRLLYLESHYRTQANFSWDSLSAASRRLNRFYQTIERIYQPNSQPSYDLSQQSVKLDELVEHLNNDLDTPQALVSLEEFLKHIQESSVTDSALKEVKKQLKQIDQLLGLDFLGVIDIEPEEKELVDAYASAKKQKNYDQSDEIRSKLANEHGIKLSDSPSGIMWSRIL